MRPSAVRLLFVFAGLFLFDFLFWQEIRGINTLVFSLFYLAALWVLFPESRASRGFLVTAAGTLLCAAMVVWHNSGAAKFAHVLSAMCAAGFAQERELRFILYAFWQYLWGWWQAPGHFFAALKTGDGNGAKRSRSVGRAIQSTFVPVLVCSVFYFLYYAANNRFAALANEFWGHVGRLLRFDISFSHLLFVIFGFFLIGAAFWKNATKLAETGRMLPDQLLRAPRRSSGKLLDPPPMAGLRREYKQSLLLLGMLNGLLLLVNATDVCYVWFCFDDAAQQDLKSYVHQGTYFLIVSILLAMAVLFQVFRKNLNFFPDSRLLQIAAACWLAQNAVLAISVGIRNWRYIDFHGLAYLRIGVALFLILVFFGLATLWLKIRRQRTMYWLWRQNSWAFYGLLLLNACVNWDVFITRYNLSGRPKGAIDLNYLINRVSDHNLFLLEENYDLLSQKNAYPPISENEIQNGIARKRRHFEEKMGIRSWKSWNLADARNQQSPPTNQSEN